MDSSLSSGSTVWGFTSVRVASLRSSGIAAAHRLSPSPDGTLTKPIPTSSVLQYQLKHGNTNALHPGFNCIKEGDRTVSKPTSLIGNSMHEDGRGQENGISHWDKQDKFLDESRIRNSRVRRLFSDGTDGIEETGNKTCGAIRGEMDCSIFDDDAVTGMSYVESEEPGEQLQQHALGIVDKIVLINDIELDGKGNPLKSVSRNSPPVLRAAGAQSMATRVNLQSPLGKEGVYDWIDSREDDRGGHFFSKRKNVLLEGIETNSPTCKTQGSFSNLKEKREATNHQSCKKQRRLSHMDPGFTSHGQLKGAELGDSGIELQKNLFNETAERSSKEFCENESDTPAINGGSQEISDVGVRTQLTAEALEALVCGSPASHDFRDAHPATIEITRDSKIHYTENEDQQKYAATKKRTHLSTSHNSSRKHLKSSSTKYFRRNSPVQTRSRGKLNHESFMNTGNCANGNECSSRRPSKLDKRGKLGTSTGVQLKEMVKHSNALESNIYLSNNKEHDKHFHGSVTPVAHRTKQSRTRYINLATHGSESTKRQRSTMGPDRILTPENKTSQFEMGSVECGSYPKRRRTCQSMSADSTPGTLDALKSKMRSAALHGLSSVPVSTDALQKVGDVTASLAPSKSSNLHDFVNMESSILPVKNTEHDSLERPWKENAPYPGPVSNSPSKNVNAVSPMCTSDGPREQLGTTGSLRTRIARELLTEDSSRGRTPALKDMCQCREMTSVHVLFSHHLDKDLIEKQKKILAQMGGSIASSPSDATHFIADKFVSTIHMLETMALGIPVVTHLWLENCVQAGCYTDEKKYILRYSKKEMEIGFNMPVSLAHACHSPLLQGKRVFITHNVKPDKEVIASLVKAVHGMAIERVGRSSMKDNKIPDNLLVISCEEDYSICEPLLERGAEVYSSKLLLNGIVIQKMEYERHRLFTDRVKRTRSTIWLRKEKDHQFRPESARHEDSIKLDMVHHMRNGRLPRDAAPHTGSKISRYADAHNIETETKASALEAMILWFQNRRLG